MIRRKLYISAVFTVNMLFLAAGVSGAIQIGKTVEYKGGNMGKVVFDGKVHNEAGYHCMKCHNDYFIPQIGGVKIPYSGHAEKKQFCFGCHDGGRAFDAMRNCNICHRK